MVFPARWGLRARYRGQKPQRTTLLRSVSAPHRCLHACYGGGVSAHADAQALREAGRRFRQFNRETNQLVAARRHVIVGEGPVPDALAQVLAAMGGRVERCAERPAAADQRVTVHDGRGYLRGQRRATAAERVDWARARMPVTGALAAQLPSLEGMRVGISLVLEPKTAVLALALAQRGARVSVFSWPEETDADIAAELARRGVAVYADAAADASRAQRLCDAFLGSQFHYLIDDGSKLIRRAHRLAGALDFLCGAAEETTSGLRALRAEPGGVRIPVVAVNDAHSKTWFDNAVGTGQTCVATILDLVEKVRPSWSVVGARVAVAGFGPVGQGVTRHLRALGAEVEVVDVDPRAALQAASFGLQVAPDLRTAVASGAEVVISATGYPATITPDVLLSARDSTVFAVAGGVPDELQWHQACQRDEARMEAAAPAVDRLVYPDGRALLILDRGGCINCTAGEGNPIEIMDLSFGVQLSALDWVLAERDGLAAGIHPLPPERDARVAAAGLAGLGVLPDPGSRP